MPPDLNARPRRKRLTRVFEDDFGESRTRLFYVPPNRSVQTHALLNHGRLPAVELRADAHDVQSAIGALRVLDERRAQKIGEERVRRWDKCAVCQNCAEVHADLSARRARYLATTNERKAQKEAGLLLLREQDENDVSGDRKGLKAAERRRRRRNVLRALAEPRNRREKVQEPVFTTTKPAKNPTAFDDNLPSVASRQPRDSTFVASIKQKAAVLREEAAQATWAAAHSDTAGSTYTKAAADADGEARQLAAERARRRRVALRAAGLARVRVWHGPARAGRGFFEVGLRGGVAAQASTPPPEAQAPDVRGSAAPVAAFVERPDRHGRLSGTAGGPEPGRFAGQPPGHGRTR